MSNLSGNVDDDGSGRKLMEEVEAETDDDETQVEKILTEKKKGIERSSETVTETSSQEQESSEKKKQDRRRRWREQLAKAAAETNDESERQKIRSQRLLDHNRRAKESAEKEKGIERSSETATTTSTSHQEQEAEDCSMTKQKKGSEKKKQDRRTLTLKDLDNIDDGGEWEKLMAEVKAKTNDKSERENLLTQKVLVGLHNRCVKESAEKKKGIESARCQTSSLEEEDDCWITKQTKTTQNTPQEFKNKIEESDTDLNPQDSRLAMMTERVGNEFLSEAEQNKPDNEEEPKKKNGATMP